MNQRIRVSKTATRVSLLHSLGYRTKKLNNGVFIIMKGGLIVGKSKPEKFVEFLKKEGYKIKVYGQD